MFTYNFYIYYIRAMLIIKFNIKHENLIPKIKKINLYMDIKQNTKQIHLKIINILFILSNKFH